MNTAIREFQQSIINFVNETNLPIEVKRLVLIDITQQVCEAADNEIKNELSQRSKEDDVNAVSENELDKQ